eukprot:1158572-Pelagomonas_calceolata.AAC.7
MPAQAAQEKKGLYVASSTSKAKQAKIGFGMVMHMQAYVICPSAEEAKASASPDSRLRFALSNTGIVPQQVYGLLWGWRKGP